MVQQELDTLLRRLGEVLDAGECRYYLAYGTALGAARHNGFIPWDVDADVHIHRADYDRALDLLEAAPYGHFELQRPGDPGYEHLFARITRPGVNHMLLRVDLFPLDPAPSGKIRQRLYINAMKLLSQVFMVRTMDLSERRHYSASRIRQVRALNLLSRPLRPTWVRAAAEFTRSLPSSAPGNDFLVNSFGSYGSREFFPVDWFQEAQDASFEGRQVPMPSNAEAYMHQIYGEYSSLPDVAVIEREVMFAEQFYVQPLVRMGFSESDQ
jgi:lipopolysaccharide cholinephosphotransferase